MDAEPSQTVAHVEVRSVPVDTSQGVTQGAATEAGQAQRNALLQLQNEVSVCKKCMLCDSRTHTVFGEGNPNACVLIIGEAPGKNEDEQGIPFVGAAGKNLDALLAIAGLSREDVFIANILKCRPPSNRNPRPEEIEACADYLRMQTRIISPKYIVTLGNFATKFILKTEVGITRLRGTMQRMGRFYVFPMFHPAAAIYDRAKQASLEDDFRFLCEQIKLLETKKE